MAYTFPEGTKIFLGTAFGTAKDVTVATNAAAAVLTSAGHGYNDGDEVLFTSGWEDATDTIWRVDDKTTDTFEAEGLDSTDTDWYPAGTGTGTVQKVTSWQEITQVLSISTDGGGPRFTTISPLARRNDIAVPTGFEPMRIQLELGYDPSLAGYQALLAASRTLSKRGFKLLMAGGETGYGYGYVSVSEMPQMARSSPNRVTAAIALLGRFVGYQA